MVTYRCPFCKIKVNILDMERFTSHPFPLKVTHKSLPYIYYQCRRCMAKFARNTTTVEHRLKPWLYLQNGEWIILHKKQYPIEVGTPTTFKLDDELIYSGRLP